LTFAPVALGYFSRFEGVARHSGELAPLSVRQTRRIVRTVVKRLQLAPSVDVSGCACSGVSDTEAFQVSQVRRHAAATRLAGAAPAGIIVRTLTPVCCIATMLSSDVRVLFFELYLSTHRVEPSSLRTVA
jgi:hypothetical protein